MDVAFYVYLGCLVFGLVFALVTGLLGGIFGSDAGEAGHDVHFGGAEGGDVHVGVDSNVEITADHVTLSPLSPTVMCFFVGVFGGMGMICIEIFETPVALSIVISTVVALALSAGFAYAMSALMLKVQGSMSLSAASIIGGDAEVTLAIPERGLGEITYVANGIVQRASAKSEDGRPIPQSAVVKVTRFTGNFYMVRRES
jgi:hypothetical protein